MLSGFKGKSAGEAQNKLNELQKQGINIPAEIFVQIIGNPESIQKELEKTKSLIKMLKAKASKTNTIHTKNALYKAMFGLEDLLEFEERYSYRDCPNCKDKSDNECIRPGCSFVKGHKDMPCILCEEK